MNNHISRFDYINDFISNDEEQALVQVIQCLPLARLSMRGQLTHRRVASFGLEYDGRRRNLVEAAPVPIRSPPSSGASARRSASRLIGSAPRSSPNIRPRQRLVPTSITDPTARSFAACRSSVRA